MTTRSSWSRYRCPAGIGFMHSKKLPVLSDADAAALANEYAAEIRARRQAPAAAKDWISLVYRLPDGLRQVLLEELDRGNLLVEIAESSWPSPRCIIGTMRDRFHGDGRACPPGVVWHQVNDIRQWRENVAEILDGREFLLMT